METPSTPAIGQIANLPAETSATRSGTIRMTIQLPDNWNPHADLLAIADLATAAGKRSDRFREMAEEAEEAGRFQQAEDYRQAARESITRENLREINFAVCLLAMRLSGCSIMIPREEAPEAAAAAPLALDLAQRREILDLLDQLAGYALEGWEEAGIEEAPQWRKRLSAAQSLLAINTEATK